jgi:hypothetical protein
MGNRERMGFAPIHARHAQSINPLTFPPCDFIAAPMELPVVTAAQWNSELVAYFAGQSAALRESEMMRVRRLSTTDEARFLDNGPDMVSIANPTWLGQRERTLVASMRMSALI